MVVVIANCRGIFTLARTVKVSHVAGDTGNRVTRMWCFGRYGYDSSSVGSIFRFLLAGTGSTMGVLA